MSWRWLIDVRGDKPRIDSRRLAIVLVLSEIAIGPVVWFLMQSVGTSATILIALPVVALLIAVDVKLRRQAPDNP